MTARVALMRLLFIAAACESCDANGGIASDRPVWPIGTVTFLHEVSLGGQERVLTDDEWRRAEPGFIRERASARLGCVEASAVRHEQAWTFSGCGRAGVYAEVSRDVHRTDVPGYDRALVSIVGVVCLSCSAQSFAADVDALVPPNASQTDPWDRYSVPSAELADADGAKNRLGQLYELNARGALDLKCPREQVIPKLASSGRYSTTPVVEGCKQRATYLDGEIVSKVEIE